MKWRLVGSALALCVSLVSLVIIFRNGGGPPADPPGRPTGPNEPRSGASSPAEAPPATANTGNGGSHDPPVLMSVPWFRLTDQAGGAFGSDELAGRAWIGTFIFTRCPATCPMQSARMSELQEEIRRLGLAGDTRLISFTVDPEHDTPEVLARYAGQYQADAGMWRFLTGDRETILRLSNDGFKLPAGGDGGEQMAISHSAKLVLVDPQGHVRGFYDPDDADDRGVLLRHLQTAVDERVIITENLLDPAWLDSRRQQQVATFADVELFHGFRFRDLRRQLGITFRHRIVDDSGRSYVTAHYDHGNGITVADVDGDGRLDLYFLSQAGPNQLWRQRGDGTFEDVTERAGVGLADRVSVSASFADTDNDGDADLYVTTVRGGNAFFENDGQGVFRDVTEAAGLVYSGHSSSAEFFDYDRDGLLDLFLVNVGVYTKEEVVEVVNDRFTGNDPARYKYHPSYADAFAAHLKPERAEASVLYRNLGDHRFENVSQAVGLVDRSWSGDASPLDGNQDGWPDLYIVNMQGHDEYYENVEGRKFVRRSRERFPATPWGTMGVKAFDWENDGDLDLLLTDMHTDMFADLGPLDEQRKIAQRDVTTSLLGTDGNHVLGNAFFQQTDGEFEEVSDQVGAENYWPWGLSAGDLNADGFEDVFIASSMNFPYRYAVNRVLLNDRGNRLVGSEYVLGIEPREGKRVARPWFELDLHQRDRRHPIALTALQKNAQLTRAIAWGALGSRSSVIVDLDGDGDLDIVTNEFNSEPQVLISDLSDQRPDRRFLKVRLVGSTSNRDGLGAVVEIDCGGDKLTKVHDGQSGYLSQSAMPLYFGLGDRDVQAVHVRWPSGKKQTVTADPFEVNRLLEITEP